MITDDDDGGEKLLTMIADSTDQEEERRRRIELEHMRRTLLPGTVLLYHEVCADTASWLSLALSDAVEKYVDDESAVAPTEFLKRHLDPAADDIHSPMSPRYWTQKALQVADLTQSDEYGVHRAFSTANHKALMAKLVTTQVLDMKYSTVDAYYRNQHRRRQQQQQQ